MEHYTEIVRGVPENMKIRDYLKYRLGLSTSVIAKVKYDKVLVNGEIVYIRATVKNGDVIDITLPDEDSENIEPIDVPLEIIYEDDYVIAVNKPKNMPVHPSRGNSLPTVANGIRAYLDRPFVFRAINRLDRDTSGIVLIAKDQLSAARLSEQMKSGEIKKRYVATVVGLPHPECGVIDAPIERECEGSMKRVVRADGKRSITEYRVLSENGDGTSEVSLIPVTGRTHQLRVHMTYSGQPLHGDFLYGERIPEGTYKLACVELSFTHPYTGEHMTVIL
jgi:23S rRNA pseudouridine1911/1915/1917 synthase